MIIGSIYIEIYGVYVMAHRISVTLPADLFARLDVVKGAFNISGICQEALAREVSRQELIAEEPKKLISTIKRLRAEKRKYDRRYEDVGYRRGYSDAQTLSYDELVELVDAHSVCKSEPSLDGWSPDIVYNLSLWEERLEKGIEDQERGDPRFCRDAFVCGWLKGAIALWETVKDRI